MVGKIDTDFTDVASLSLSIRGKPARPQDQKIRV